MSAEIIMYQLPGVPGGGTVDLGDNACGAQPERELTSLTYHCTLPPHENGQHEAGIGLGMMVAAWTDDDA